jgi:hypothetical protein
MSDWLQHILDNLGEPIPCAICREPTDRQDLTEATVPGIVIREWDIVIHRVAWICPRCPRP